VNALLIGEPDLEGICRSTLGCAVARSEQIGAGRNSRVFRVDVDGALNLGPAAELGGQKLPSSIVVKFYRRDPGDNRDRLGTEFGSLQFLWENGVRAIPRPIVSAPHLQCGIYEFIPGEVASQAEITAHDVDRSVDFLQALDNLRGARGSESLPAASEACFTIAEILGSIDCRLERLTKTPAGDDQNVAFRQWLHETFAPVNLEVREWCLSTARRFGLEVDQPIAPNARTLTPSDFGFHNAIRRSDGSLTFVDFEYFGWDDPAKTIVDYLLHPGMRLGEDLRRRFASRVLDIYAHVPLLASRVRVVYPLFGLKWALILLNQFLPERARQASADDREELRITQLQKAQLVISRLAGEYRENPYLS